MGCYNFLLFSADAWAEKIAYGFQTAISVTQFSLFETTVLMRSSKAFHLLSSLTGPCELWEKYNMIFMILVLPMRNNSSSSNIRRLRKQTCEHSIKQRRPKLSRLLKKHRIDVKSQTVTINLFLKKSAMVPKFMSNNVSYKFCLH